MDSTLSLKLVWTVSLSWRNKPNVMRLLVVFCIVCFKDSVKEVPPIYKQHEILHDLHIAGAHVGIMKLYYMVRH